MDSNGSRGDFVRSFYPIFWGLDAVVSSPEISQAKAFIIYKYPQFELKTIVIDTIVPGQKIAWHIRR